MQIKVYAVHVLFKHYEDYWVKINKDRSVFGNRFVFTLCIFGLPDLWTKMSAHCTF